jgi:D-glycero-D-manno-heptose 1,7-bisphosphate phosphatase
MEPEEMMRPAIFLDRDGVINRNRTDHVKSWAEFEFLPGVLDSLRRLAQLEWPVVVISNQAIVGRGLVSRQAIDEISEQMTSIVWSAGGRIDCVFYCPHRPDEHCECRKPRPGLLLNAAKEMELDLTRSFFVGDAESDVLAAKAVGCRPVLVKTGRGFGQMALLRKSNVMGYYLADDLSEAVNWILGPGWMTKFYPLTDQMPMPERGQLAPWLTNAAPWAMSYPH